MSSFSNPHFMYLFDLKSGKKKLAYGESPEDALDILRVRLTDEEMDNIHLRRVGDSVVEYFLQVIGGKWL